MSAAGSDDYARKTERLVAAIAAAPPHDGAIGLAKKTSNLFRDRVRRRPRIDLSHFDAVVAVDRDRAIVEAEGMTTFVDLADATLAQGMMPAVVPQLKSITLGGAVAGVGIEATSFRHGLVHDTIVAMDVLTGDGHIVTCSPDDEHRDLFHGFPNSYGTLGYVLKLTARTLSVERHVRVEHARHDDADRFFSDLANACADDDVDFVDGVAFGRGDLVLSCASFVDAAPWTSDYTFERIYYRSLREKTVDYLTTRDYLWRWDTDWFWCSRNVGAQHPLLRRLYGRRRLNSITYQKIMRWNTRVGAIAALNRLRGIHSESVIQDVDIPLAHCAEFLDFLFDEVGILPIWICPIRAPDPANGATLYPLPRATLSVNFGFWDSVATHEAQPAGLVNRRIERKVAEVGGIKSLYSDAYFTEDEFWAIYNRPAYAALKARYDPQDVLGDLYRKVVLRA
ncbi:MAG TPA: FAD-binding oxidoreductase [Casimicrobiaceae bacterium]